MMIIMVSYIPSTLAILSGKKVSNGGWMAICKPPMWEEYKNSDTLVPWKFTDYLIYLIKNTPQDDCLVLIIIDEPSPKEYDNNKYPKGDNNEDAYKVLVISGYKKQQNKIE